jgi:ABC transporter DrrB family efflux protein
MTETVIRRGGVAGAASDGWVMAKRNLIKIKRVPDILVFVLISPIMFVLLFAYVFGGAIDPPGSIDYKEFLVPGIFAQTVVFGATFTGYGLADDMQKGIIDRFRSLPMSQSAVLIGRTTSDVAYNIISLVIMGLTGLLVGWRIREGVLDALLGFLLLLAFAYSISWIMAYVGLLVPSVEVVNNASFIVIFPLTFVSNAFVPQESFDGVLRTFVEWNPVSTITQACRELFGNTDPGVAVPDSWAMQNPEVYTLLWAIAIVAIFAPLSARQYRLSAKK